MKLIIVVHSQKELQEVLEILEPNNSEIGIFIEIHYKSGE